MLGALGISLMPDRRNRERPYGQWRLPGHEAKSGRMSGDETPRQGGDHVAAGDCGQGWKEKRDRSRDPTCPADPLKRLIHNTRQISCGRHDQMIGGAEGFQPPIRVGQRVMGPHHHGVAFFMDRIGLKPVRQIPDEPKAQIQLTRLHSGKRRLPPQ